MPAMRTVTVTGDALTLEDLVAVARGEARAELGPDVEARMRPETGRILLMIMDCDAQR